MSALKSKNISSLSSVSTGDIPFFMSTAPTSMNIYYLPTDELMPAPDLWNFYKPLTETKMLELICSITDNGLLHPIVVWKRNDGYMILSGHNRVKAYQSIYAKTGDSTYLKIGCSVFSELSDEQAKEIIVDSNWVQRNLTVSERARSVYEKYVISGRKKRAANGSEHVRTYDIIASEYSLSGRQIHRYLKLNQLVPSLLSMVEHGKLSIHSGAVLAEFSEEIQLHIFNKFGQLLDNTVVKKLKKNMDLLQIEQVFCDNLNPIITVSFAVPSHLVSAFREQGEDILKQLCKEGN